MLKLATIDFIFLAIIVFFAVKCALSGFVAEVLKKLSVVLGVVFAWGARLHVASFLRERGISQNPLLLELLAVIFVFVCVFLLVQILMHIISAVINSVELVSSLDKTLGFFFGIIEGLVIVVILLWLLYAFSFAGGTNYCNDSFFFHLLMPKITVEIQEMMPAIPMTPPAQVL
ncbi:MAG: CvpA family protein [Spirochaetaceae bacterium]|nr:CvpA family protein [Spirochaetaceae bacterium]